MQKEKVLARLEQGGLVAVVRAENTDQAMRITQACLEGGVAAIEMTFTTPHAHRVIEELAAKYSPEEILLGAGTVLDPETARIAILSGAQYVVSPHLNADTQRLCNRYRVACMPGVATLREAVTALEGGADILKVFPGELYGPQVIKAFSGPLPQARMMPTGGVTLDNVGDWLAAGAVAVGVGGSLTAGAKTGDWAKITATAKAFMAKIQDYRKG